MHPKEPVVLQLIFTLDGTEHRTRMPDSKPTHNTNLTREDTSLIRKSPQESGQSQQPSDQNSVETSTTTSDTQPVEGHVRTKLEEATLQQSLAFPQPQLTRQRATKNSVELNTLPKLMDCLQYTALRVPIPNSHITIPAQGELGAHHSVTNTSSLA